MPHSIKHQPVTMAETECSCGLGLREYSSNDCIPAVGMYRREAGFSVCRYISDQLQQKSKH